MTIPARERGNETTRVHLDCRSALIQRPMYRRRQDGGCLRSERVGLAPAEFNRVTKCRHKTTGIFRVINFEERLPSFILLFGFMIVSFEFGIENIPIFVDERCLDVREENNLRVIAAYLRFVTSGVTKMGVQMRFD